MITDISFILEKTRIFLRKLLYIVCNMTFFIDESNVDASISDLRGVCMIYSNFE